MREETGRRPGRPVSIGFETVNTGHDAGPCWLWQGTKTRDGYPLMNRGGFNGYAHRWYYEQLVGPIPEGMQLDHLCEVRSCCAPHHLEPVSPAVNVRRSRVAKLTEAKVRAIREMWRDRKSNRLKQADIGSLFGVSQAQVSFIVNEKQWKNID